MRPKRAAAIAILLLPLAAAALPLVLWIVSLIGGGK